MVGTVARCGPGLFSLLEFAMRYVVSFGIGVLVLFAMALTIDIEAPAGDRADRLERIERALADVLERVKRIEAHVTGRPETAPVLKSDGLPEGYEWPMYPATEPVKKRVRMSEAPLPVNPKTGKSRLVEAMEEINADLDRYQQGAEGE